MNLSQNKTNPQLDQDTPDEEMKAGVWRLLPTWHLSPSWKLSLRIEDENGIIDLRQWLVPEPAFVVHSFLDFEESSDRLQRRAAVG